MIGATDGNTAVLNLGGVANVTWWDGKDTLIAFDAGPANAPINDFIKGLGLGEMDRDGALALRGPGRRGAARRVAEAPLSQRRLSQVLGPLRLFCRRWRTASVLPMAPRP